MSLQCIFIYNHHKDTRITLKASADITYNNEQHVRISLFDASSWPIATENGPLYFEERGHGSIAKKSFQITVGVVAV
jgi:hypothetical protein